MTSYAKQMTAAGYRKVKVTDLKAGDVVKTYATGAEVADRTVATVTNERRGLKRVTFACGATTTSGNTGKFWLKG